MPRWLVFITLVGINQTLFCRLVSFLFIRNQQDRVDDNTKTRCVARNAIKGMPLNNFLKKIFFYNQIKANELIFSSAINRLVCVFVTRKKSEGKNR